MTGRLVFGSDEANQLAKKCRYQHLVMKMGMCECPNCEIDVQLTAETDEWTYNEDDGGWDHFGYGPAHGQCKKCARLFMENIDGRMLVFNPGENGRDTKKERDG